VDHARCSLHPPLELDLSAIASSSSSLSLLILTAALTS
jgi:hypothetical protein